MSELADLIEEMRNGRWEDRFRPNPPATLAEIEEVEKILPFPLPKFYKEFLFLANGGEFRRVLLFGIHPTNKAPSEFLHPRTLDAYEQLILSNDPAPGHQYSMQGFLANISLVQNNVLEPFSVNALGYGEEIEDRTRFMVLGSPNNGDLFVTKPHNERLLTWIASRKALDDEVHPSLADALQSELVQWKKQKSRHQWLKTPWRIISRLSNGEN